MLAALAEKEPGPEWALQNLAIRPGSYSDRSRLHGPRRTLAVKCGGKPMQSCYLLIKISGRIKGVAASWIVTISRTDFCRGTPVGRNCVGILSAAEKSGTLTGHEWLSVGAGRGQLLARRSLRRRPS